MLRIRVVQCLCTQCEGELLHLYEVCLSSLRVCRRSHQPMYTIAIVISLHQDTLFVTAVTDLLCCLELNTDKLCVFPMKLCTENEKAPQQKRSTDDC